MEFDADWIWFAVFAGVMIVRALGSMISRARKRESGQRAARRASQVETAVPTVATGEEFQRNEDATPIEPR